MFSPTTSSIKPFFYLGKIPIGVTGLIILLEIIGMLGVVIFGSSLIGATAFSPEKVFNGEIWRVLTFPFFEQPSLFFVIGIFFFYQFGTMTEQALGRQDYLSLIGGIIGVSTVGVMLSYFVGLGGSLTGNTIIHFALFCAFCVMNPNLPSFFGIKIKWFALVFVCLLALQLLAAREFGTLLGFLFGLGLTQWFIEQKGLALISIFQRINFKPTPKSKAQAKSKKQKGASIQKGNSAKTVTKKQPTSPPKDADIDRILDKINEKGIHSLTNEEKRILQSK